MEKKVMCKQEQTNVTIEAAAAKDDVVSVKKAVSALGDPSKLDFGSEGLALALEAAIQFRSSSVLSFLLDLAHSGTLTSQSAGHIRDRVVAAMCRPGHARKLAQQNANSNEAKKSNSNDVVNGGKCESNAAIARVERALEAIRNGEFVIVQDSASRENEGDLIIAAEKATAEQIAFMVNETSGLICVGVTDERCKELQLPQMVKSNTEAHATAFTVSVDYLHNTTTGISAADRALTIKALTDKSVKPGDFSRPGHIFPLRARAGGVLERGGHTEASVDLARLAGLYPAAAMCEISNRDGTMARSPELKRMAKLHGLELISIEDMVVYRKAKEGKTQ